MLPVGPRSRRLGLDPSTALAVDELPQPLALMLDELHEPVEPAALVARAVERGGAAEEAHAVLSELVQAGALIDGAGGRRAAARRADGTVVVVGDGPVAVGVVVGLVHAGVGAVHADAAGSVRAADLGTGYLDDDRGHDRRAATSAAVRRLCPAAAAPPPPQRLAPDLVVLADDLAPDPVRVAELHTAGTAHLAARLRDGVGVVGPLVLPGRSACLGCLELHRCARDPEWPRVSALLVGRRGSADPACTAATAALATAQALAALDGLAGAGSPPPTLDAALELDPVAGTLVRRSWAPWPGCRCRSGVG